MAASSLGCGRRPGLQKFPVCAASSRSCPGQMALSGQPGTFLPESASVYFLMSHVTAGQDTLPFLAQEVRNGT